MNTWGDNFASPEPTVKLFDTFSFLDDKLKAKYALETMEGTSEGSERAKHTSELISALDELKELSKNEDFYATIGAAKTCYAKSMVSPADVATKTKDPQREKDLAHALDNAGHHTPFQHRLFSFGLDGISRQFVWGFLHSHPFYNSEQVSQRFREINAENVLKPKLSAEASLVYDEALNFAFGQYDLFNKLLSPAVAEAYAARFPTKRGTKEFNSSVQKKTQEISRYFAPISTTADMYHSITPLVLARYLETVNQPDVPVETAQVVYRMVDLIKERNPDYASFFHEPIPREKLLEEKVRTRYFKGGKDPSLTKAWAREFDSALEPGKMTRLVDYKPNAVREFGNAVRNVLGVPQRFMSDAEAVALVLDPRSNEQRGKVLALDHLSKLARSQYMSNFTFAVKISHTGDSQAQRQRMCPASRPVFEWVVSDDPDYIVPSLIAKSGGEILERYHEGMRKIWSYRNKLKSLDVSDEFANYVLPNSTAIRYNETFDLLNFIQKDVKRECLNAQEEIGRVTLEQRVAIEKVHPELKGVFGPPCYLRVKSGTTPICPEGDRYCGVPVFAAARANPDGTSRNPQYAIETQMANRTI